MNALALHHRTFTPHPHDTYVMTGHSPPLLPLDGFYETQYATNVRGSAQNCHYTMGKPDPREFIEWYDAYGDALFRFCYYRVHQYEQAKDLVQDVFTQTWEYLCTGHTIDNGKAFLYRVALNAIINASKKRQAVSLEILAEEQGLQPRVEADTEAIFNHIDAERMIDVLNQFLDEKDKNVIILRYINELSPREIATITDESENVISVRLHRAVKKARALVRAHNEPHIL